MTMQIQKVDKGFSFSDFRLSKWDKLEKKALGQPMVSLEELDAALDKNSACLMHDTLGYLAVGGVTPEGGIWFLTSHKVDKLTPAERLKMFMLLKRHLKAVKQQFKDTIQDFYNIVWILNYPHISLLKLLGAKFEYSLPIHSPKTGEVFYQFTIQNEYYTGDSECVNQQL
ncbi:putative internal virion protein A [Pasteurella phage PHB01]|uniref:Internal (Core) protein n=2 Tax=Wuhanvirus TaxID=2731989 RepID=A0A7G8ZYR9_9CAUD|nr:internal virion protein [Pasteurella phage PHB01]ASD51047.1 putative internal virion protein A [Pasteurella phage PHB01]QNL29350.1 internal (core) protein [Pasteurella phage vB_PmuP_Pa7]